MRDVSNNRINVQCRILTQRDNPAQFGRFNNRHELSYVDGTVRFSIRVEALEPERNPIYICIDVKIKKDYIYI